MVTKNYDYRPLVVLILLTMLALLPACSQNREPAGQTEAKGGRMNAGVQIDRAAVSVPPIDTAAPDEFETATFGLG